jgi:hypothetical protein
MNRLWCVTAGLAFLAGGTMVLTLSGAKEKKPPSIKEIMTKAHKGGNSLIQKVGKDLKEDEPNWADVQKKTKQLVSLGSALGKNEPPQGEKDSWDKLTKQYVKNAKALDAAAKTKDKEKAEGCFKKLTAMCAACHKVHKPQD